MSTRGRSPLVEVSRWEWLAVLLLGTVACGESAEPVLMNGGGGSATPSAGASGANNVATGGAPLVPGIAGMPTGGMPSAGLAGMSPGDSGGSNEPVGGAGGGGMPGDSGPNPRIPRLPTACPTIAAGAITVLGQQVRIWTGPAGKKGPLLFYWHGTRGEADQALVGVAPALEDIQANGGVVASFTTSTDQGLESGPHVWHVGDFEMTDVIFACAVDQGLVEPRRVYTAGCSAGGLQSSVMMYQRSSYLAAAMPNSGGLLREWELEDPKRVPALISTHGGPDDFVGVSFEKTTARLDNSIVDLGGFVVNCDHGGGHCDSPPAVKAAQWRFLKAHPFGEIPSPYAAALPANFPKMCEIAR